MPVSEDIERLRGELDSLYERLDQFEQDTSEIVTAAYVESVRAAIDRIELQLADLEVDASGQFVPDVETAASARAATLQDVSATREVWNQWEERLQEAEDLIFEGYDLSESVDGGSVSRTDLDQTVLSSLRGQWPGGDSDLGSGLAGRFYQLSAHHRRELADAVTRHALGGATPRDLRQELSDRLDIAKSQAEREIRDATIQHSRQVNQHKAEQLGYEYFEYTGPLDQVTRPFCRGLLNNGPIFSREEIADMNNGQTGAGTVFVAGGGYRCRHHWQQVRKRWLTDDEWEQARGDREQLPASIDEAEDEYRKDQKELRERQDEEATSADVVDTTDAVNQDGETRELVFEDRGSEPDPESAELEFDQAGHGTYEVGRYDPNLAPEDRRWAAQDNWVHGSRRKSSVLMQEAARREFDLDGRLQTPRNYRYDQAQLDAMRGDVGEIYDRTQSSIDDGRLEELRDEWSGDDGAPDLEIIDDGGTKKVRLYRGVALEDGDEYENGAVESWTADPEEAVDHARRNADDNLDPERLQEDVPVDRILTHTGGPEWHDGYFGDQAEFVVMSEAP